MINSEHAGETGDGPLRSIWGYTVISKALSMLCVCPCVSFAREKPECLFFYWKYFNWSTEYNFINILSLHAWETLNTSHVWLKFMTQMYKNTVSMSKEVMLEVQLTSNNFSWNWCYCFGVIVATLLALSPPAPQLPHHIFLLCYSKRPPSGSQTSPMIGRKAWHWRAPPELCQLIRVNLMNHCCYLLPWR